MKNTIFGGCMFSRKTSSLILAGDAAIASGWSVGYYKPLLDTRYGPFDVVTHTGERRPCIPLRALSDIVSHVAGNGLVVAIDEISLFPAEDVAVVLPTLVTSGHVLYLAGFDYWHDGRVNLAWAAAAAVCESVVRLTAMCPCGSPATRTLRIVDVQGDVAVGGDGMYQPRCFKCWTRAKTEQGGKRE